jgi:peptidoglycan hydrolase-like protein with peptidoglycan-binding domain
VTTSSPQPFFPQWPGYVIRENPNKYDGNLKIWQIRMRARGWRLAADGVYGPETRGVVRAFQQEKGLAVDGLIGKQTWDAAWTSRVT